MSEIFTQIAAQGVLGLFLVLSIWYFRQEIKHLREEMKLKSAAHAEQMKLKDDKINELNDKIHSIGIEAITSVKELNNTFKDLMK